MSAAQSGAKPYYYVPQPSHWPITGSCALLLMAFGAAFWFNAYAAGPWLVLAGFCVLVTMMFGWFGTVVGESEKRLYNRKVDLSFRWGMGVEAVQAIDSDWVADQARCLLEDMPIDAFKIGALGSVENIAAIAEILSDYPDVPLVLDPVLASGRGDELANDEMLHAMRELLLPQTTILTPNSLEARRLADTDDDDEPLLSICAQQLIEIGCEFVLITGTHEPTPQVVNTLYGKNGVVRTDTWQRLPGTYHERGHHLRGSSPRHA